MIPQNHLVLLFFCIFLASCTVCLSEEMSRPELPASSVFTDIPMDGTLTQPEWSTVHGIDGLTMVEPKEGARPSAQTIVKVLANPKEIILGIWCKDPDAKRIVSFSKERDADLTRQDHIKIVLDGFQDGTSGYVFVVNPSGARYDALIISGGSDEDKNWDGIWEAAASVDQAGWKAEIKIPIQTLTFKKSLRSWNFNIERRIQRFQETDRWASPQQDYLVTQTSRAGLLTELPDFSLGWGLTVRPAETAGGGHPGPGEDTKFDNHPSLDVWQRLGPNLLSSLTVNTDFAETEADTRQINLTRFPVFFPEKRTFFLEGSDIFDFGLGLGTDLIPFFSRKIGLIGEDPDSQQEVPLDVGGKLNGRIGQTNVGALVVRTRDVEGLVPNTTLGVLRVRQNVLEESSIGMIATAGDPFGIPDSYLTGTDFTYRTSRLFTDKNFQAGVWGILMDRSDLNGSRDAYGFRVAYPNDLWDIFFDYKFIDNSFQPSLGFVPRDNSKIYGYRTAYQPRPERFHIRQMFEEFETLYITDLKNKWESYEVFTAPVNWRLESGDRFEFNFIWQGERLDEPFEISNGVTIPTGSYEWMRYRFEIQTAEKRKIRGIVTWGFGDFYDGTLNRIEYDTFWNPSGLLSFEFLGEHDHGVMNEGDFTEDLVGTRVGVNLSPDLQVSSFLQYDTGGKSFGTNTRMRWTIRPTIDLFVIYNHNLVEIDNRWIRQSNELLVKLQYAFRR
jgi:Domain of unknown function (DUF5916)